MGDFPLARNLPALALLAVIALLLVSMYQSQNAGVGRDDLQKLMARMDALDAKFERQGQASGLQLDRDGVASPLGTTRQPSSFATLPSGPHAPLTAQQSQQDQARIRQELESLFATQGPAPRSDSAPQQVTAALNSDGVIAALDLPKSQNVKCRADMCLIQGRFALGADASDWATRVMLELGATLPSYRTVNVPQPDGGYELRVYATRKR